jgi:hypothetical protein
MLEVYFQSSSQSSKQNRELAGLTVTPEEFKGGQGQPLGYASKDNFTKAFMSYIEHSKM